MNDGGLEMEARLAGNLAQMSTIQASPASDSDFICRKNGRSCAEKLAEEFAV
jgi:hypothetical protein